MEKEFQKCWRKVNGGTWMDQPLNPQRQLVKYHCEVIYREAVKMKVVDHVKTIICVTTVLSFFLFLYTCTEWRELSQKASAFDHILSSPSGTTIVTIPYTGTYKIDGKEMFLGASDQVRVLRIFEIIKKK